MAKSKRDETPEQTQEVENTPIAESSATPQGGVYFNQLSGKLDFSLNGVPFSVNGGGRVFIPTELEEYVHSDLPLLKIPNVGPTL